LANHPMGDLDSGVAQLVLLWESFVALGIICVA
jgi:hypothetical protein